MLAIGASFVAVPEAGAIEVQAPVCKSMPRPLDFFGTGVNPENRLQITVKTCVTRSATEVYGLAYVNWRALGSGDPAKRFSTFDLDFALRPGQHAVSGAPAPGKGCLVVRTGAPITRGRLVDAINSKRGDAREKGEFACPIRVSIPSDMDTSAGVTLTTAVKYGFNIRKVDEATGKPFYRPLTIATLK